jgi:hypothetical protein
VDVQVFHAVIIIFPLIALALTAFVAVARGDAAAAPREPGPGIEQDRPVAVIGISVDL